MGFIELIKNELKLTFIKILGLILWTFYNSLLIIYILFEQLSFLKDK